jgi:glycosyltransferase involved in cell wall biosynthesis
MRARPVVLVASPSLEAISGVATHALSLLRSPLQSSFDMRHFQVGAEGRAETPLRAALRLAASPFLLAAAILRHDAAIVHLNTSLNARAFWRDAVYAAVAKLCGASVVLQKHGGTLEEFRDRFSSFLVRNSLKIPDAVAVLSRAELAEYSAFLPGQNIALLSNGIDPAPFRKGGPKDGSKPLRLIYLGRLAPRKGLDEILDAMALLRGRSVAATLTIAGSGPEEARLKLRAGELGLDGIVQFAGPAYGERKAALLGEAHVLVLPSHGEGLPYAVLEGMAAGAAPVVTRVGAIPDVVEEGVHGRFVPVADAGALARVLEELAGDRERLSRLGAASRRRIASGYSIERLAGDVSALYAALVPARAPRTIL